MAVTVLVAVAYLAWAGWYTHFHRVERWRTSARSSSLARHQRANQAPDTDSRIGSATTGSSTRSSPRIRSARDRSRQLGIPLQPSHLPAPGRCRSRLESGCRSLDTPCSWDHRSCSGHLCARDDCRPPRDLAVVRRARRRLPGALSRGVARPRRSPRVRPAVPRFDGLDGSELMRRRRLALIWHCRCNP